VLRIRAASQSLELEEHTMNQLTSPRTMFPMTRIIHENLKEMHDNWFWFLALGILLIVLGLGALTYTVAATLTTALVFGCLLLAGGVFYIVGALFTLSWGGFFLSLFAGVLHLAAGFIIVNHPAEAVILYTLMLAVFFFVEGLFRIIAALAGRFRNWSLVLLSGFVTLLLGILIWRQLPWSGLYAVGILLGINLVFSGAAYIALALDARKLPA
jgi:uncharacterized membrane protein HdeD (DUF308 family)